MYSFTEEKRGHSLFTKIFFDIHTNAIFIIPGGIIHRVIPDEKMQHISSIIQFDPALIHDIDLGEPFSYLEIFQRTAKTGDYKITPHPETGARIEQYLLQMRQQLEASEPGYRFRVLLLLHQMLVELMTIRAQEAPAPLAKESKSHMWMREILSFISSHLDEDLSLTRLANQALVSPPHFSRVFRQLTGFQVTEYLLINRILLAKELLRNSQRPIALVAEQCGFHNISHFHRMFRRHIGLTPGQFRKQHTFTPL